ncbi:hypothetical protein EZ313_00210 [Ramlibacter henchirensis]|uniref:Tetratricopeptide repeat protein n=1 Tax=Ramlibacter henchirensis TaxID=204072 RepID=A0A4Z0C2G6_9BURK|nr:hypothetical protein [Ramlibacter henchirensis]TFZ05142.1 hypothetical protein EZ313_00210 [Ramlibacter henchirensis]
MSNKVYPAGRQTAARTARFGLRAVACCAAALLGAPDALALSLGRMQGAPLIGRPLQLSLPVTLQSDEELACLRAELQQPDVLSVPLTWRLDRNAAGATVLRLSSTQVVQEPVITVKVVVGCNDQLTQGYVLLADPPPARESVPLVAEAQAPAPTAAPAPPAAKPSRRAEPAPAARQDGTGRETAIAAPAQPPAVRKQANDAPSGEKSAPPQRLARAPAPKAPASPAAAPASEGRPRLQVDLLDIAIDQAPALKVSTSIAPPAANALTRTEAVAAWQQINSPPEDPLAAERAQAKAQADAVQAELRALREQTRRQSEQLQKLVEERNFARDILSGIAGAVALGFALLLWRRSRETAGGPWWQKSAAPAPVAAKEDSSFVDSSFPEEPDHPVRLAPEPDSGWAPAKAGPASVLGTARIAESAFGRSRLPSAEELLDVQDKANFFIAVGQPEKAIELLESRLMEHLGASPFLWLDLLDLCRKLNRRDDYERVRSAFQKAFAARMPRFEDASTSTEGIERYPKALSRIALLWPTSRVLQEIEHSLFEEPAPGSIQFDLEASRDLLLLYSIALDVVTSQPDGRPYDKTEVVSLLDHEAQNSTMPMPLMALDTHDAVAELPPSLDLDLGMDFGVPAAAVAPQSRPQEPTVPALDPGRLEYLETMPLRLQDLGPAASDYVSTLPPELQDFAPVAGHGPDVGLDVDLDLTSLALGRTPDVDLGLDVDFDLGQPQRRLAK